MSDPKKNAPKYEPAKATKPSDKKCSPFCWPSKNRHVVGCPNATEPSEADKGAYHDGYRDGYATGRWEESDKHQAKEQPDGKLATPATLDTVDESDEILADVWIGGYEYAKTLNKEGLEALREANTNDRPVIPNAKARLQRLLLSRAIGLLEELSLDVIEPCEPDCDPVRHALHQGSWDAHLKIEAKLAELIKQRDGLK